MTKVLMIQRPEDKPDHVCEALEGAGLEVACGECTDGVLRLLFEMEPDIVIVSGDCARSRRICAGVREVSSVPIICIEGTRHELNLVTKLALGADAYLYRPLGAGELVARVHSLLRRSKRGNLPESMQPSFRQGWDMVEPEIQLAESCV